jgi:predicted MPP superfamily phosphohydrolase
MSQRQFTRRQFLKTTLVAALGTTGLGAAGITYAHAIEPARVEVNRIRLRLPRLAPEFDGFRLAQISDLHMDRTWMSDERLTALIRRVNDQQPDAVAITGDFVTAEAEPFADALVEALRTLNPHEAAVAILGNHDHWTNAAVIRDVIRRSGLTDVNNGVHTLRRGKAKLHLAGVDDVWEKQDRLDLVLQTLPDEGAAILLAHEPDYADTSAQTGRFDLQLSGHSHGGQFILPFFGPIVLPYLAFKYPVGQYQVGPMIQYTNRGLGMVHPQIRLNCPPEITVFTLEAPQKIQ